MSIRRARALRRWNRLLVRQEATATRDIATVFRNMAEAVASRYAPGDQAATLAIVDEFQPALAAVLERTISRTALLFGGETLDRIERDMPKSYYGAVPNGPVRGRDEVHHELKDARRVFEASILAWVRRHALRRAVTIMATAKDAVRRILVRSFEAGEGEAATARAIREQIGQRMSATSAARIARTEMHTASTRGADEAARSTGLEMVKEWASAEDARTRRSHAQADGQEVPLNEPFRVGGSLLMYPGDPAGPPREVINCRCAILHHPIIGGVVIR